MTKTYVSPSAKSLLKTIGDEYELQFERYMKGFIEKDQLLSCLIERLNAKSKSDPALRRFLSDKGFIPKSEDTDEDVEWAEDKRDDSFHEVNNKSPSKSRGIGPARGVKYEEDESDCFPLPGERVC